MKFTLVPDYIFEHFYDVTPEFLHSVGLRFLVLDIDNTLEPYENDTPSEQVVAWLQSLREKGIECAFVSNNSKERVEFFNDQLSRPAYYKARKPLKKNVVKAMNCLGADSSSTAVMGDQIFTDVWAARNAGVKAILLPPIRDKKDLFTKFKRLLEKPIIRKYEKRKYK